jgi:hypothetical protein
MKRRAPRIAVLLRSAWYLSGPLFETFDFWYSPRAEVRHVRRSAGGAAILLAAVSCFAISFDRKWQERSSFLPGGLPGLLAAADSLRVKVHIFRDLFLLSFPAVVPATHQGLFGLGDALLGRCRSIQVTSVHDLAAHTLRVVDVCE